MFLLHVRQDEHVPIYNYVRIFPEFGERLFASSVFVPEFLLDTGVSFFVLKPMSTIGALIALYLVSFTILFD
jgi:hypothetical protein